MTEPVDSKGGRLRPVVAAELARGNRVKHGWHQEQFDVHWGTWWVLELESPIDLEALATEVELPQGVHSRARPGGDVGIWDDMYQARVFYRAPTPPPPPPSRRSRVGAAALLSVVVAAAAVAVVVGTLVEKRLTHGRYVGGGAYRLAGWLVAAVFLTEMALLVVLRLLQQTVSERLGAVLERLRGRSR